MNAPQDADGAIREKLAPISIPIWARPWARPTRSSPSPCHGNGARVELVFGFPCADYGAELLAALQTYLDRELGEGPLDLT